MAQSLWRIDGDAYDLRPFARWHPGGADLLHRTRGRDISTLFHAHHRDASRLAPLLRRYRVDEKISEPRAFRDAKALLKEAHVRLGTTPWQETVWTQDSAFAITLLVMCLMYGVIQWRAVAGELSLLPYAVLMSVLRICLSSAGHYFVMKMPSMLQVLCAFLMDVDYRHSALEELKRRPFEEWSARDRVEELRWLPRLYRLPMDGMCQLLHPVRTCFEFGRVYLRWHKSCDQGSWKHLLGFILVRGLLIIEVWWLWRLGKFGYWTGQCWMTSLFSFVLVICDCYPMDRSPDDRDWAVRQIETEQDVVLTGYPYLDCFLTGGMSCRRVHKLLPYQRSPFANIASEALLKQIAEEKKIEWKPPVRLVAEKLDGALDMYLFRLAHFSDAETLWQEHVSLEALQSVIQVFKAELTEAHELSSRHEKTE